MDKSVQWANIATFIWKVSGKLISREEEMCLKGMVFNAFGLKKKTGEIQLFKDISLAALRCRLAEKQFYVFSNFLNE